MFNIASMKLMVRAFYDMQDIRKKAQNRVYSLKSGLVQQAIHNNWVDLDKLLLPEPDKLLTARNVTFLYDIIVVREDLLVLPEVAENTQEVEKVEARIYERINRVERAILPDICEVVHELPIWREWLQYVYNIAETLTGALYAEIYPISRFDNPSKLYAYSGYDVIKIVREDGVKRWFPTQDEAVTFVERAIARELGSAERWGRKYDQESKRSIYLGRCVWGAKYEPITIASKRIAGLPYPVNVKLKETLWKCGKQFVKSNSQKSQYRCYYEECKEYYVRRDGDKLSKGQVDNRAMRKTVKLFASHLWHQWRKVEGLPTVMPYMIEKLGHRDFIPPFYDKEP